VNIFDGGAREIKYDEEWSNGRFIQNELVQSKAQSPGSQVTFYNEIPAPLLKTALEKFGKGNKEKQQNIVQAIWILLFGEGATTTSGTATSKPTTPTTPSTGTGTTTKAPQNDTNSLPYDKELKEASKFNSALITRTRRTTKYKVDNNCKNPPKKHKDTEYVDDS
jgi:hypothetical protein